MHRADVHRATNMAAHGSWWVAWMLVVLLGPKTTQSTASTHSVSSDDRLEWRVVDDMWFRLEMQGSPAGVLHTQTLTTGDDSVFKTVCAPVRARMSVCVSIRIHTCKLHFLTVCISVVCSMGMHVLQTEDMTIRIARGDDTVRF